jgi:hypothetical protein
MKRTLTTAAAAVFLAGTLGTPAAAQYYGGYYPTAGYGPPWGYHPYVCPYAQNSSTVIGSIFGGLVGGAAGGPGGAAAGLVVGGALGAASYPCPPPPDVQIPPFGVPGRWWGGGWGGGYPPPVYPVGYPAGVYGGYPNISYPVYPGAYPTPPAPRYLGGYVGYGPPTIECWPDDAC